MNKRKNDCYETQKLDQQLTAMQDDLSRKVQQCQDLKNKTVALERQARVYKNVLTVIIIIIILSIHFF